MKPTALILFVSVLTVALIALWQLRAPLVLPFQPFPDVAQVIDDDGDHVGTYTVVEPGWGLTAAHVGTPHALKRFDAPGGQMVLVRDPELIGSSLLTDQLPAEGEHIRSLGYHEGTRLLMTEGLAQPSAADMEGQGAMSCPIFPGCSGGPVFDSRGRVFGLNASVWWSTIGQQGGAWYPLPNVSFFYPVDPAWVRATIEANR